MDKLEVKYRTWYKGVPPKPIKLQMPGWAGESNDHSDGAKPQPWMCPPFVDGSTYGLELIYPFDAECHVTRKGDEIIFQGDFTKESGAWIGNQQGIPPNSPPFLSFAPDHYGMTSSLDIMPPEGYCFRIEPHPRFYTDRTGTVPIASAGNIQRWWGRIFFVAFKSPMEGETHIFRHGEPYAHVLIIPNKPRYDIKPMTTEEADRRGKNETILGEHGDKVAKHNWTDHKGMPFNDKYKVLARAFAKGGEEKVQEVLDQAKAEGHVPPEPKTKKKIPRRLIRREALSHQEEKDSDSGVHSGRKRAEEHLEPIQTNHPKKDGMECPFHPSD